MRTVAIIQARLGGGTRFGSTPKILADVCGKPMLARVVERTRMARGINDVVVATPADKAWRDLSSQRIDRLVGAHVLVYEGPREDDVLSRYELAARDWGADNVVRITADCPCLSPEVVEDVACELPDEYDRFWDGYWTTPASITHGFDCQGFTREALMRVDAGSPGPYAREHVVPAFASSIEVATRYAEPTGFRLTVDYPEDLNVARKCYEALGDGFSTRSLLQWLGNHPEVVALNAHRSQR